MRIAIFTETYTPYVSGVVVHIRLLKRGLEALGHEVLIVTADPSVRRSFVKDGVYYCPAVELKKIYSAGLASPVSLKRMQYIADFKPDIIHIHTEYSIGLFGLYAARRLKIPAVYTLHTMYDDYTNYIVPKPFTSAFEKVMTGYLKAIAMNVTSIIGPSEKAVAFCRRHGVHKRVTVINNCPDLEAFLPANADWDKALAVREKYGVPASAKLLIMVSRIGYEKSIDVLMDYFASEFRSDESYYMMVVGDGPAREDLILRAQTLGLADRIIFTGSIPNTEVPHFMHAADIFTTASISEMFSISMLEAQGAGLPAFVRHDPYNDCQIKPGINGYIYHDSREFGELIRAYFTKSPAERKAFSLDVSASVSAYGPEELARNVLHIYEASHKRYALMHSPRVKRLKSPVRVIRVRIKNFKDNRHSESGF